MSDQLAEHTRALIIERIREAVSAEPLMQIQPQPVTEEMWCAIAGLVAVELRKAADDIEATL